MESGREELFVRVRRRVHPGLTLDVTLVLDREIGVVFGRSGAGKTTLLRLIAGLSAPDDGLVRLGGVTQCDTASGRRVPLRGRRIGMIFQDDLLFPHLDVAANIRFGLKGWPRELARQRVAEVACLCGVAELLSRRPETLSGGERQRVGLARALAPRPGLLLCDEPVSALDLANRHTLIERLRDAQKALAIPILYVTHSPAEAIALGSRLFLMEAGRIVAEGPPLEVLGNAARAQGAPFSLDEVRNVFPARVVTHLPGRSGTVLALDDGPELTVPYLDRDPGVHVVVDVRADEIVIARQPIGGLSARNQLAGVVRQVVCHGAEAEAVVVTGGAPWIVSLIGTAVDQLELEPGSAVVLIVKARSCRLIG